jgi:hypothetical protein
VDLELNAEHFTPGMPFLLQAHLSNPGPESYEEVPFCVLLDVFGEYYWYPLWERSFDYVTIASLPAGSRKTLEILQFTWPDPGDEELDGIYFHSAMLTQDLQAILGEFDSVSFGFGPAASAN